MIVAAAMTGILAFGAYTIDIGSGREAQTKAQSAADSAAAAAASAMASDYQYNAANPSTPKSTATIQADAKTAAASIAQQNGVSSANVTVANTTYTGQPAVQVSIRGDADTSLGKESGRNSIPVLATAVATYQTTVSSTTSTSYNVGSTNHVSSSVSSTPVVTTQTSTTTGTDYTCATAGDNCMAIFAKQTGCSGTALQLATNGGGVTINGGVWSNGSLNIGQGGSHYDQLTYGTGCTVSPAAGIDPGSSYQGNTFNDGLPKSAPPLTTWPLDYSADFPACSSSGPVRCTGPLNTPSYCTMASKSATWAVDTYNTPYLETGQIYCGIGGGTPSNPTSWTGTISLGGGGSGFYDTFVAGGITVGGGTTVSACGYRLPTFNSSTCPGSAPLSTANYPLFYAETGTIDESSGGNGLTGDWFVPNGGVSVGGGTAFIGFIEASTVNLIGGGIQGDGPADNGTTVGSTTTTKSYTTGTTYSSTTSYSTSTEYNTSTTLTPSSVTSTSGSRLVG